MSETEAYVAHLARTRSAQTRARLLEGFAVWFDAALPAKRSGRALDYGAGPGDGAEYLKTRGFAPVETLEPNSEYRKILEKAGWPVCPELRGPYDLIFCKDVLEHLEKPKVIPLVRAMRETLAPGGRLVVSVPNAVGWMGNYTRWEDWTHETIFTQNSLRYVLESAGFTRIEFHGPRFGLTLNPFRLAYRFLRAILHVSYRLQYWIEDPGSPSQPPHFFSRLVAVGIA
ncbi:MAG: class I SAM-dependent methyltransferase [Planctomycetes bacterium]|nr:class I SAM-dependent methyltransferase [Planctomycetota bacterium]